MPDVINSHFFEGTSLGFNGNTGYFSNKAGGKTIFIANTC